MIFLRVDQNEELIFFFFLNIFYKELLECYPVWGFKLYIIKQRYNLREFFIFGLFTR